MSGESSESDSSLDLTQAFLVFRTDVSPSWKRKLSLVKSLPDVIRTWTASTRVSPVFIPRAKDRVLKVGKALSGKKFVTFLGPMGPDQALQTFAGRADIWLTMGCYNLILVTHEKGVVDEILHWAVTKGSKAESWSLDNGDVVAMRFVADQTVDIGWREPLAGFAGYDPSPELRELLSEYCPLIASAITRAARATPGLLPDLYGMDAFLRDCIPKLKTPGGGSSYEGFGILTTVNAALSRFSSQAFSGTTPIAETECHFWSHSLLGIGVANLALWRFSDFLEQTLGEIRIPQRVAGLASQPAMGPRQELEQIPGADEFWYQDHLKDFPLSDDARSKPLLHPITCFSGRDGFRATEQSLSAPLAVLASCNSERWSLLTLTHELTHNVIRGVLASIYPEPTEEGFAEAVTTHGRVPDTALEQIKRLLIIGAFQMQACERKNPGEADREIHVDLAEMRAAMHRWKHEIEEIMVHVFDFLWFYRRDHENYIRGIWLSWSVIPNIESRVPNYVLRTLCAISTNHLRGRRPLGHLHGAEEVYNIEDVTRSQVEEVLKGLRALPGGAQYARQALDYLDKQWPLVRERLVARRLIVRIVETFLYSTKLATEVRGSRVAQGGSTGRDGYSLKPGLFTGETIDNPLRFINAYTGRNPPKPQTALWMLYTLAFNIGPSNGEAR